MNKSMTQAPLAWTIHGPLGHALAKVTWKGGRSLTIQGTEDLAHFLNDEVRPLLEETDIGAALTAYFVSVPKLSEGRFRAQSRPREEVLAELKHQAGLREAATAGALEKVMIDRERARYKHNELPLEMEPFELLKWTLTGKVVWEPTGSLGRAVFHAEGGTNGTPARVSVSNPAKGMYRMLITVGFDAIPRRIDEHDTGTQRCVLGRLWDVLENGSDI